MQLIFSFIFRASSFICVRSWRFLVAKFLRARGVGVGEGVVFYGWPLIGRAPDSSISIGSNVVVCSDSRFTALGVAKPVILRTLCAGARIEIGADTGMSGTVVCAAQSVLIGRSCLIGADVAIVDTDFHPLAPEGRRYADKWDKVGTSAVVIEDNVFIGAGVRVLKGVRIGANSVIGAGSVVVESVPANSIAAGVPCRVVGAVQEPKSVIPAGVVK